MKRNHTKENRAFWIPIAGPVPDFATGDNYDNHI